jgi:hypothetical protein
MGLGTGSDRCSAYQRDSVGCASALADELTSGGPFANYAPSGALGGVVNRYVRELHGGGLVGGL